MKVQRIGLLSLLALLSFAERLEGIDGPRIGFSPGPADGSAVTVQSQTCFQNFPTTGLSVSPATVDPCGQFCLTWCSPDYSATYPYTTQFVTSYFALYYSLDGVNFVLFDTYSPSTTNKCLYAEPADSGRTFYFRVDAVGPYTGGGRPASSKLVLTLQSNRATLGVRSAQRPTILSFIANPASIQIGQSSTLSWSSSIPGPLCGGVASIDNGIGSVPASGQIVVRPQVTTTYTLTVTGAGGSTNAKTTVTVDASCPVPEAPLLSAVTSTLSAGQMLALGWPAVSGLRNGRYDVEASRSPGFETPETAFSTTATNALVQTRTSDQDYPLYVRIRAIQGCGGQPAGPWSRTVTVSCTAAPPHLVFTKAGPGWTAIVGGAPPSATVVVRNVGGQTASVSLTASGGFFDVPPASLWLPAGREATFTLTARAQALVTPGTFAGTLTAAWQNGRVGTSVTLSVAAAAAPGVKVTASTTRVLFSAPLGQTPEPQTVTLFVSRPAGTGSVTLSAAVAPAGAWLVLPSTLGQAVPSSGQVSFTLSVNRGAWDTPPPISTLLSIGAVGASAADAALIEVVDTVPPPVTSGAGAARANPAPSFIVPSVVRAAGLNDATYYSDGWLRNLGSTPVSADLFLAPDGKDGISDLSVLRATLELPAGTTRRLTDVMATVFGAQGSGQLEIRSPIISALSLRTTTDALTGGDPTLKFGSEMPVASSGSGGGLGDPARFVPGVSENSRNRTNLIFTETTGKSAVADVTISDDKGRIAGTASVSVPAYGKVQKAARDILAGASVTEGSASISVSSGAGRVVTVATILDNQSNSFSAAPARIPLVSAAPPAAPKESEARELGGLSFILPSAVRARGQFDTQFVTGLHFVNGTASEARLTLTYFYTDLDDGNTAKTIIKDVVLPPRGSLDAALGSDAILDLFHVTNQSAGWIRVEGDAEKVLARSSIGALVDPNDPSRGMKTAEVDGFPFLETSPIGRKGAPAHRFAGLAKGADKRSNLVLVETSGRECTARVTLLAPNGGQLLAEKSFTVRANQYFQINDVFGDQGLGLGEGPFRDVEVTVEVVSGDGNLVSVATVNDNISRNPVIFVLRPPGPPDGGSIGF